MLDTRLPAGHLLVRLLGVGVSGFDGSGQSQGLLFDHEEQQKHRQVDVVVDQIKERFGGAAVRRASSAEGQQARSAVVIELLEDLRGRSISLNSGLHARSARWCLLEF